MRRVLTLTAIFITIFALLIGGMVSYARAHPTPQDAALAALLDPGLCTQPCWHGIELDKVTYEDANAMMLADKTLDDDWSGQIRDSDEVGLSIILLGSDSTKSYSLNDVLAVVGDPIYVNMCVSEGEWFTILDFNYGLEVTMDSGDYPNGPHLGGYIVEVNYYKSLAQTGVGTQWQGFKDWNEYKDKQNGCLR